MTDALVGNKSSKAILASMEDVGRKALDDNQTGQATFLKSICDLFNPSAPKEGFVKYWPLILETWRKHPETRLDLFTYKPGTNQLAESPETVFHSSEFFTQGLDWLLRIAKGNVSLGVADIF